MNRCQGLKNVPILESNILLYVLCPKKSPKRTKQDIKSHGLVPESPRKQPSSKEKNTNVISMIDLCNGSLTFIFQWHASKN